MTLPPATGSTDGRSPDDAPVFTLHRGRTPLLVSLPHVGTALPAELRPRLVERALAVEDTDWLLDRLYGFVVDMGASLVVPRFSRYVIDLNRPREDTPLYTGRNGTGLVPDCFFTGEPLYRSGHTPTPAEVAQRIERYWQPYHDALRGELERLRQAHGHAVLFDGHSIKSSLPWLFDGVLPHLNLGTADGASCDPALRTVLAGVLGAHPQWSHVVDGRFKGGYITRHHGQPANRQHAVQLEMCWRTYLDESRPGVWHPERAAAITPLLRALVQAMIDWRPR
jgi:N-formylglutamate deformylase